VRAGFVFVPTFGFQFYLAMFYALNCIQLSHCCELLPVAISYKTAICTDEFWQNEVNYNRMCTEEKNVLHCCVLNRVVPKGGGGLQSGSPQTPPKTAIKKKHGFCMYYDIKSFT
jgi:hypothetical protein